MKKILISLLAAVMLLSLAACGNTGGSETTSEPAETTSVSRCESVGSYPHIEQKLSWEAVNAFPIKSADMTTDEMRQLCVDFFRYAKTALWTPDGDLNFIRNSKGTEDEMSKGIIYGGLPYVGLGSGNIYRLMDYMDPETGVVDIANAAGGELEWKTFGNQCSIGAYWGWGRVINSADYKWTQDCVVSSNMPRVGPYTYDDELKRLTVDYGTPAILKENGREVMNQAYAALQIGDGLVYYTTAGHVIMCSSEPHVEYAADGTIDPGRSYITIIDQGQSWLDDGMSASGDAYTYKGGVDTRKTFFELYEQNYIPFTFREFLGEDPVEETEASFSHTGETITMSQLFQSKVTANYGISDIYAIVYDDQGNEVYKHAVRAMQASMYEMRFIREQTDEKATNNVEIWGKLEFAPGKTYQVEIVTQLATGERPSLYTGTLTLE